MIFHMLQQIKLTHIYYINLNIIEKFSLKTSKAMKLSIIIRLKSQKAIKLSPLHFYLSMPTRKFEEKRRHSKSSSSCTKVVFSLPKYAKKDQNMTILGYSCRLQSSLYTKNHRFTLKSLIFCQKTIATFFWKKLYLSKFYP